MNIKNQKGAAIITVLIVVATMTALVYLNMYRRHLIMQTNINREANSDIEEMVANISTTFLSPKDCNSNLHGAPSSGAIVQVGDYWGEGMNGTLSTAIYKCQTSGCQNSLNPREVLYNLHSASGNWMYNSPGTTKRARLISATWAITGAVSERNGQVPQYYPFYPSTPGTATQAAKVTISLKFQKNLSPFGKLTKISNGYTFDSNLKAAEETYTVDAFVIVLGGTVANPIPGTQTIKGCAKAPNSPSVY